MIYFCPLVNMTYFCSLVNMTYFCTLVNMTDPEVNPGDKLAILSFQDMALQPFEKGAQKIR